MRKLNFRSSTYTSLAETCYPERPNQLFKTILLQHQLSHRIRILDTTRFKQQKNKSTTMYASSRLFSCAAALPPSMYNHD